MRQKNEYTIKRDRIAEVMRGHVHLGSGKSRRRLLRYTHGRQHPEGMYWVGYTWMRPCAGQTGNVYEVVMGRGNSFEAALEDAIEREARKRDRYTKKAEPLPASFYEDPAKPVFPWTS